MNSDTQLRICVLSRVMSHHLYDCHVTISMHVVCTSLFRIFYTYLSIYNARDHMRLQQQQTLRPVLGIHMCDTRHILLWLPCN